MFFSTKHTVSVGLPIHVMVNIAERFNQRSVRLFTGRVKHIEPKNFFPGSMGIGVEFFYSEPLTDELVETMRTLAALLPKRKRGAGVRQLQEVAETMAETAFPKPKRRSATIYLTVLYGPLLLLIETADGKRPVEEHDVGTAQRRLSSN